MSDIKTNIPLPVAPLTGPDGRVNEVWWRFFLDIFNRTGGGTGNDGTVDPVYPDISISLPLDTQNVPLPDVSLPFSANAVQEISPFDALFVPTTQEAPLLEMAQAPIVQDAGLGDMVLSPVLASDNPVFASVSVGGGASFLKTTTALTNGAAAATGTLTNAPAAGNPTKWIGINDNGVLRYIPSW